MHVKHPKDRVNYDGKLSTAWTLECTRQSNFVVESILPYDARIQASMYQLYLPSRQDIADQFARVIRESEKWNGPDNGSPTGG